MEIHLDPIDKNEVYEEYAENAIIHNEVPYSYNEFCEMWRNAFPHVRIRQYKAVSGKCDICERLKALLKVT